MDPVTSATTKRHENSHCRLKSKRRVMQPLGMYNSAICCEQLITNLCPAFSKMAMGLDAEISAGFDQEPHLLELIRHIEAAV